MATNQQFKHLSPQQYAQELFGLNHQYWNGFKARFEKLKDDLLNNRMPKLERIALMLTERCNFDCIYCNHCNKRTLKLKTVLDIIDACEGLGARIIAISGGEITLEPEILFATIERAKNFQIFLSSNGYFNSTIRKKFLASQIEGINISLDSCDAAAHDSLVQVPNSWKTVVSNIQALSQAKKVYINTMVTNNNFQDLPERLQGFYELFPDIIDVQLIPPRNAPNLYLSLEQIDEYYASLARLPEEIKTRFPLANIKLSNLFGTDGPAQAKAAKGCYTFNVKIPCYLTLQELRFAPVRGVYNCGCLQREFEEPLMSMGEFLSDPVVKFLNLQMKIFDQIPFSKRCLTACGPETNAFNFLMDQCLK